MLGTATSSSSDDAGLSRLAGHEANEQKFMVLTSSMCRTHGCRLSDTDWSRGRAVLSAASSPSLSFHTINRLSLPCLRKKQRTNNHISARLLIVCISGRHREFCNEQARGRENLRNDFIVAPAPDAENGALVGSPDSPGTHDGQIPEHHEAFSIAGCEALVISDERR